jgi:hypothetical protein
MFFNPLICIDSASMETVVVRIAVNVTGKAGIAC